MTFEKLRKDLPYAYNAFKNWIEENGIDGGSTTIDKQASEDFCKDLEREKIFCQSLEEADFELRKLRVKLHLESNHFDPKEYTNMGQWESIEASVHTIDIEIDDMKVRFRHISSTEKIPKPSFIWAFIE